MKVAEKLKIVETAVKSISRHDDAEKAYVEAALDKVVAYVEAERAAMSARREAKWKAELAGKQG